MVVYEVTLEIEPHLVDAFIAYLREHIGDVLATGCFQSARLDQLGPTTFRSSYLASTHTELNRYLEEHSVALRADVTHRFPQGFSATRQIWEVLERWEHTP